MGMFDTITVSYPGVRPGRYQTKDLECGLDEYELRTDGSLVSVHQFNAEDQKQIIFTGTGEVRFYTDFLDGAGWIEYSAYYSHGKLLHLEQVCPANPKADVAPASGAHVQRVVGCELSNGEKP